MVASKLTTLRKLPQQGPTHLWRARPFLASPTTSRSLMPCGPNWRAGPALAHKGPGMTQRAVLLDLDGTLMHTLPDLNLAANRFLQEHDLPPLPDGKLADFVGKGSRDM